MARDILAIELDGGHVNLAAAEGTMRQTTVTALASAPASASYLSSFVSDRDWDLVIASLPADLAFYRMLELPFRDRRRLSQVVGPALEEHVPGSLEDCLTAWDYVADRPTSGSVLAAMANKEAVERHIAAITALGAAPDRIVWAPSATLQAYRRYADAQGPCLVVDTGYAGAVVAVIDENGLEGLRVVHHAPDDVFLRNIGWALGTLAPASSRAIIGGSRMEELQQPVTELLSGYTIEALPQTGDLQLTAAATPTWRTTPTVIGLLAAAIGESSAPRIEFATSADGIIAGDARDEIRGAVRTVGPWAAAVAALLLASFGLEQTRLHHKASALESAAESAFRDTMPPGSKGPGRKTKMELRISELERRRAELTGAGPSSSPMAVLASMSANVPDDIEVEFETYNYDPPNVRLRGQGDSFESVTRLQQSLAKVDSFAKVEVNDVRSAVSGEGVVFELSIKLGDSGGDA